MLSRMRRGWERIVGSASAFRDVVRNRNLVCLELAWTTSILSHYAFLIAVSVYAFEAGGDKAVGLLFLVRLVPAALVSPFAGMLGDRYRRERVLLATNIVRAVLVGAAAIAAYTGSGHLVVYALAVAATIATTPFRSAQAALTPTLARNPVELTAANAVASGVDSIAFFAGPALAGLLLVVASTSAVFVATALALVVSAIFVAVISVERAEAPRVEIEARTIVSEAFAGFGAILSLPSLRFMMGLLTAQTLAAGAVQVYIVVAAIRLLDLGTGGVGYLNSAMGVGAVIGAIAALGLTGVARLSPAFMLGVAMWGLPLVVVGVWPVTGLAIVMFALIGLGNSIADVASLTIVQRAVPDDVMARVFGVIQMLWYGSIGIGAALAPALIAWVGLENALIVTGAGMTVLVAASWAGVARIDKAATLPEPGELRVLTAVPIFTPLPGATLEHLAGRLVPLRVDAGTTIVREGDAGDRFYIVAEGELEVTQDATPLSEIGQGDYFGEIALLRDLPRTATVTAKTDVVLYALDRDEFLGAVTGHPPSAEAAETVVSSRLVGVPIAGSRLPA
jgi:MFS family permease